MPQQRQYAVVGPLPSARENRSFLGVELVDGQPRTSAPLIVAWLSEDAGKDTQLVARVQRETALVTHLDHPHVERVHGLEAFEEGWARVVDYSDGESLERLLEIAREKGHSVPPRVAARIVADACEGIGYAHDQGQGPGRSGVHGAVRLDTIAVTFGGVSRVTGFGASGLLWSPPPTHAATRNAFLTPEQVVGGRATASPSTDVYGLGAVLYALLAGRVPFAGEVDVESAILAAEPAALGLFGAGGELAKVALTALAKRGPARFASPAALRQAIVTAVGEQGLASPAEVAAFVSELVPQGAPERVIRRELLEASGEMDALTLLVRPGEAATPVPRAPSRVHSAQVPDTLEEPLPSPGIIRAPRPRDETTQIDGSLQRAAAASRPEDDRAQPRLDTGSFAALAEEQVAETTDRISRRARAAQAARLPPPPPPSASLPSMPEAPAGWGKPSGGWAGSPANGPGANVQGTNGHGPRPAPAPVPGVFTAPQAPAPQATLGGGLTGGVGWGAAASGSGSSGPGGPPAPPAPSAPAGSPPSGAPVGWGSARAAASSGPPTGSPPGAPAPAGWGSAPTPAAPPASPPGWGSAPANGGPSPAGAPAWGQGAGSPPPAPAGWGAPPGSGPAAGVGGSPPGAGGPPPGFPRASGPAAPPPGYGTQGPAPGYPMQPGYAGTLPPGMMPGVQPGQYPPYPGQSPGFPPGYAGTIPPGMMPGVPMPGGQPQPPQYAQHPGFPPGYAGTIPPGMMAGVPGQGGYPQQPQYPGQAPGFPPGYPGTIPPGMMAGVPQQPGFGRSGPPPGAMPGSPMSWSPNAVLQPSAISMNNNRSSIGPNGGGAQPGPQQGQGGSSPSWAPQMARPPRGSVAPIPNSPTVMSRPSMSPPGAPRTSLPPNAVQTPTIGGKPSMPPQPIAPVPRAPMREVSSVTNFKKDVGDSSRSVLFIGIAVLVVVFGVMFAFPKAPPAELVEEAPTRHALPKELVREALSGNKAAELPPAEDPTPEPPPPVAPGTSPAASAAAVAAAASAPPVEEPKTGVLNVTTDPIVDVYAGSKYLGKTPLRVELATGVHKLRFTDADKLLNLYKSYRVRGGADTKDSLSFGTSQLKVLAPDGAQISLNGKSIGVAPLDAKTIFEGKYVLKVVHDGKSWSQSFDAPAGRTIDYKVWIESE